MLNFNESIFSHYRDTEAFTTGEVGWNAPGVTARLKIARLL